MSRSRFSDENRLSCNRSSLSFFPEILDDIPQFIFTLFEHSKFVFPTVFLCSEDHSMSFREEVLGVFELIQSR